jgi:hypothetical protein
MYTLSKEGNTIRCDKCPKFATYETVQKYKTAKGIALFRQFIIGKELKTLCFSCEKFESIELYKKTSVLPEIVPNSFYSNYVVKGGIS